MDLSRLQVWLTIANDPAEADRLARDTSRARSGLQVLVSLVGQQLLGLVVFRDTGQSEATLERYVEGWLTLLACMVSDPSSTVAKLPLIGEGERSELLGQSEGPKISAHDSAPVHVQFERQAALHPDTLAVVCANQALSYRQLNARSNQLAHRLLALGVRPDDRVVVCVERSLEMLIGILGVLKAGACYVPVDPTYPANRISYMLDDSAPIAVLTKEPTDLHTASAIKNQIPLSADAPLGEAGHLLNPERGSWGLNEDHLAYMIYTSGSTGQPKGSTITHGGLSNMLGWFADDYALGPDDRNLVVTSSSFDLTQKNLLAPLLRGGQVHLSGPKFDPDAIVATIAEQAITTLNLTPSFFAALVDSEERFPGSNAFRSMRRVFLGGEPILVSRFLRLQDRYPRLEVINSYGPTECTDVVAAYRLLRPWERYLGVAPPIGRPIQNTRLYVLDDALQLLPAGATGELWVGGSGVSRGYLGRADLTAERFLSESIVGGGDPKARMYKTGDLARWLPDGNLEYLGRNDFQVKIRGFRIELGEIEVALAACAGVRDVAVVALDAAGEKRLVAYVSAAHGVSLNAVHLKAQLAASLAEHMVPGTIVILPTLPLTPSGKVDRLALPKPARGRPDIAQAYQVPVNDIEELVCSAFGEVLDIDAVGRNDNLFDLGGTSLGVVRVASKLARLMGRPVSVPTIFANASPRTLALAITGDGRQETPTRRKAGRTRVEATTGARNDTDIAVIAMSARLPGASTVEQFWKNLLEGRDSITDFTVDTLDASIPAALRQDPGYVKARGIIEGVELFDNQFFGISPREAEVMDPQHRIFLEIAWECLERGGYAPDGMNVPVGVYAGVHAPTYLQQHVLAHPEAMQRAGEFQILLGNDKDYAPLRVADKFGLCGPAMSITTACSTSLVAVVQAVDHLRLGRCRMALAGGVAVTAPYRSGYLYQEGSMLSEDARTRTFDARGTGTAFNDGAACVLLKRLSDALADGDPVYAVIRGAAVNNDGGGKASFSAPSVDGQAAVIEAALDDAGVDPRTVSYVEAHGTATPLGDPVEVEALTRAYRRWTADVGFCRIGSAKSNIGHTVTAAGAAGLIKTAMALHAEVLPATIHFEKPNPQLELASSPFVVNDALTDWPMGQSPRRAAVSSFGVGGTNAHVILEEAPARAPSTPARGMQLLQLSARSKVALDAMAEHLAAHLEQHPDSNLADVAYTLSVGRSRFDHRLAVAAESAFTAARALRDAGSSWRVQHVVRSQVQPTLWLFPGQGAQYTGMGRGLCAHDPVFRTAFDEALVAVADSSAPGLRDRIVSGDDASLRDTAVTQPATFCLEYALAQAWLARGVEPVALIGHSVGEFAVAVVSGVMTLADAGRLVVKRGALMQSMLPGAMLSVRMAAGDLLPLLPPEVELAADNGPLATVVAGPTAAVDAFAATLAQRGVMARRLETSHAFHSAMMDPAVAPFEHEVRAVRLKPPHIAIFSTLTGQVLSGEEATSTAYWARHLREPVRFSTALTEALAQHDAVLLEVGPRGSLSTLARQHRRPDQSMPLAIASLGDSTDTEVGRMAVAQGELWTLGLELPAPVASPMDGRQRVRLPTYPFERKSFWLSAGTPAIALARPNPAFACEGTNGTAMAGPQPVVTAASVSSSTSTGAPAMTPTVPSSRIPGLIDKLKTLFEDVAGLDMAGTEAQTRFIELGFDSLTLTQVAQQVKREFNVPVRFRQLMEEQNSLETLARFIDAALPPDPPTVAAAAASAPAKPASAQAWTPPVPLPAVGSAAAASSAPVSLLQQVIQQQMQLMSQQLAMLGGAGAHASAASDPTPAPSQAESVTPPVRSSQETQATDDARRVDYDVKKAFGAIARIHTQASALTERQRGRLDAFIRRYVQRTKGSKDYTAKHRAHTADPRVVNGFRPMTKEIVYQIVVDRSHGARVWDIDGNEYIDVLNGFGMNLFGWRPDFINDALRAQLDKGYEIGPQHVLAGEVSELLAELTGFDRAGLCNTGSEAVMAAMRIARTVTGRDTIVVFAGSYHGTFDEVLVRAGRGHKGIPAAPGILPGVFGDIRVLDYGTPESLAYIRDNAEDLAAVLVEPVQSRRPDFQPVEFLREVRRVTSDKGSCLIFDEVITGFRSHLGGVQSMFGIRADLATYGKVIGGGLPIGAIAGKREFMDALDGGHWQYGDDSVPTVGVTYFAGTFVRHPLALAAAKAALSHLKGAGAALQAQLNESTAQMADELTTHCREVGAPIEVRYFSSMWRVTWLEDHPLQDLLFAMMRNRGVHILDNFPCFMTTAHTAQDIALIKTAFKEAVAELQESDFLPRPPSTAAPSFDATRPPMPGARLGRDAGGKPAWFVSNPEAPGKYIKVETQ